MVAAAAALAAAHQQMKVLDTQIAEAQAEIGAGAIRSAYRHAEPRLHRNPLADRRLCRQSRRTDRRLCHAGQLPALGHPGAGPVDRREFQGRPARAHGARPARHRRRRRLARPRLPRPRCKASRRAQARCSASFRRKTPPAISPRSCSACRSASRSIPRTPVSAACAPACPPPSRVDTQDRAVTAPAAPAPAAPGILPFVVMCVGMFMALLDIQIVASSLAEYRRRLVRRAG